MPSLSLFFLGLVDTVSALIIIYRDGSLLWGLAYYIGIILLIKGIWSIITSLF